MRAKLGLVLAAATLIAAHGLSSRSQAEDSASSLGEAPARPNVVFVMVDDMRDDDLRYLPEVQSLIGDQGVRFRNSFSPYPLCCPARASVLTGRYTHNHRVYTVYDDYGFHAFDDRSTLATMLDRAGYANVYLGKYLNRYGIDPPPTAERGNSLHYVPPGWDMWRASLDGGFAAGSPDRGSTYNYYDTTLSFNGEGFERLEGRYQTVAYGDIARDVVSERAAAAEPFLLYLSFTAPHGGGPREADDPPPSRLSNGETFAWRNPARPPYVHGTLDAVIQEAPGASWHDPDFSDKPAYLRKPPPLTAADRRAMLEVTRQRAEALTVVDQQVGELMRTLADTGELDQTLVIFTSDNGYFLGEQRMRQGKVFPHEPSLRVPLLMRGPGIPAGEVRRDPFTSVDFLPTIAAATGTVPEQKVDGISLWDVARHGDTGWTRGVLTETGSLDQPPRDTNEAGEPLSQGGRRDIRFLLGVRTHRYLYVDVAHQRDELYDLNRDPHQYRNLVAAPRYDAVRRLLAGALADLRACRGAACSAPLPSALQWRPPA